MVILKPSSKFKLRGTVPALSVNFGCQVVSGQVVKQKTRPEKKEQILGPDLALRGRSPQAKQENGTGKGVSRPCPDSGAPRAKPTSCLIYFLAGSMLFWVPSFA